MRRERGACAEAAPKEIRRLKLAVNSACPLRCAYCLLDKDAGEVLPQSLAEKALDFFLDSPGARKKLLLYGGEPMLAFDRVRSVALYAAEAARRRGKQFGATVATGGVVAVARDLDFMRERGMTLSVSLDGSQESHDRFRRYADGRPSFARVVENLPRFFDALGPRAVTAILCVHPENAVRMYDDFVNLARLGFQNANIEVVHGFPWSRGQVAAFARALERIGALIRERLEAGGFLFLESFAVRLQREPVAERMCPLHSLLEVFPNGDYSFYPFPFVKGLEQRPLVKVGGVEEGLAPRYASCRFDPASSLCRGCAREYYALPEVSQGNEPYAMAQSSAECWIEEIALKAREDERYRNYVREALVRSAMGYR